jgi:hypothetical protein
MKVQIEIPNDPELKFIVATKGQKGFQPMREVRSKLIALRLSEDEYSKIDQAIPEGFSRSEFIRRVMVSVSEKVAQSL